MFQRTAVTSSTASSSQTKLVLDCLALLLFIEAVAYSYTDMGGGGILFFFFNIYVDDKEFVKTLTVTQN